MMTIAFRILALLSLAATAQAQQFELSHREQIATGKAMIAAACTKLQRESEWVIASDREALAKVLNSIVGLLPTETAIRLAAIRAELSRNPRSTGEEKQKWDALNREKRQILIKFGASAPVRSLAPSWLEAGVSVGFGGGFISASFRNPDPTRPMQFLQFGGGDQYGSVWIRPIDRNVDGGQHELNYWEARNFGLPDECSRVGGQFAPSYGRVRRTNFQVQILPQGFADPNAH